MIGNKALAFIKRDHRIETSYKVAFLLRVARSVVPLLMFFYVGKIVDQSTPSLEKYGGDYFPFVLVGLAFHRYFELSLRSFSQSIRSAQMTGCLEAMLSSQTSPQYCVLMSSLYSLIAAGLHVVLVFAVGWLGFGFDFSHMNVVATLVIFLLAMITFVAFGIVSAAFIVVLKRGDPFGWLVITLTSIVGGAYFPVDVMPDWLQLVARVVPATYALDALRLTILQGHDLAMVGEQALVLAGMALVMFPASVLVFGSSVRRAKFAGTLVHY